MFSRRSAFSRTENALTRLRSDLAARGWLVLDLTRSNPTEVGLPGPASALAALADPAGLHYRAAPLGLPEARAAIADFMCAQGPAIPPERIVVTASTSEAYAFLFKLLCDPGDELLLPSPSYPLFEHLCRLEHVSVRPYALAYDGRFHVQLGALEEAVTPQTRAVVAVHPNNPTGNYLGRDEIERIAALGLPLISDEVFAPYRLVEERDAVRSAREIRDTLCFSLHGLSKLAALPQLKLSWICVDGPDALVAEALGRLEIIADAFLSVATPVQLALPGILKETPAVTARILARAKSNLESLRAACRGTSISVLNAQGGWYAVLRLPAVMDDEAWALRMLGDAQVLVQPGYFYDFQGGSYLVVSLITPEAELEEGLTRLLETVAQAVPDG